MTNSTIQRSCDFCSRKAAWDAPTTQGPWAYMCGEHYRTHANVAANQDGVGTNLADLERRQNRDHSERKADLYAAIDSGDMDAAWDAIGDGDIVDFL